MMFLELKVNPFFSEEEKLHGKVTTEVLQELDKIWNLTYTGRPKINYPSEIH